MGGGKKKRNTLAFSHATQCSSANEKFAISPLTRRCISSSLAMDALSVASDVFSVFACHSQKLKAFQTFLVVNVDDAHTEALATAAAMAGLVDDEDVDD